jgi:hypothetical protein
MSKQYRDNLSNSESSFNNPHSTVPNLGVSNSMMQEQLFGQNQLATLNRADINNRDAELFKGIQNMYVISDGLAMSSDVRSFSQSNVFKAMCRLVDKEGWDPEYAAAWLGQAVVETGNPTLEDLDVVEYGSGAGRGMFQYTGERRRPYDRARQQALSNDQNPNDIDWQIDYALDKDNAYVDMDQFREGLTDPDKDYKFNKHWGNATGKTANGQRYDNKFSTANELMDHYEDNPVGGYSRALTGEFTRPGVHHLDRREKASKHILRMYRQVNQMNRSAQRII